MKLSNRFLICVVALIALTGMLTGIVASADDSQYKLGPDSQIKPDVPQGKITEHTWKSQIFDGTNHWRPQRHPRRIHHARIDAMALARLET